MILLFIWYLFQIFNNRRVQPPLIAPASGDMVRVWLKFLSYFATASRLQLWTGLGIVLT